MMKIRRTLLAAITATALLGNAWAQEAAVGVFRVGHRGLKLFEEVAGRVSHLLRLRMAHHHNMAKRICWRN